MLNVASIIRHDLTSSPGQLVAISLTLKPRRGRRIHILTPKDWQSEAFGCDFGADAMLPQKINSTVN